MPSGRAWKAEWRTVKKILCIRLDTLGDVLMTTPAFRAIKESLPGVHLTLMTSVPGAAVAPMVPEVDAIDVYQSPWMKATSQRSSSKIDQAKIAEIQKAGYDAAIIFTVFSQNPLPAAMLAYLANIPLRLGYCRENPYQLLTHWVPEQDSEANMRHESRRHLDLVQAIGCATTDERLSLRVPEKARRQVFNRLQYAGVKIDWPWVVIHPGATAASRRYPVNGYAQVVSQLTDHGFQVVLTGDSMERELVEEVRQQSGSPAISLAGELTLEAMAALLERAPLLISNNTGPVHMAAALGTPVVDLYALTNPQHTPWLVPNRVLFQDVPCKYCFRSICPEGHHNCLRLVSPDAVVKAALDLWAETAGLRPRQPVLLNSLANHTQAGWVDPMGSAAA